MTARLGSIILAVDDVAGSVGFYRRAFDWPQTVETPVYAEFELPEGLALGLYERQAFGRNTLEVPVAVPPEGLAGVELYLIVDDLPSAVDRLREAGARLLSGPSLRDWGEEVAYLADPAGHVVALAHRPLSEA